MAGIGTTNDFDISAADGVTTVFTYTFFAYNATDVKVYSVVNDVETEITAGFTVTPSPDFIGGSVTFTTAPGIELGDILRRREIDYTQTTEFSDITRYKETAIERALNTIVMQIQQVKSKVERALRYSEAASTTDVTISTPVDGALLGFDGVTGKIKAVLLSSLSLTGLDTVFTGLTTGDFFIYNGMRWVNRKFLSAKGTSIASAATTDIGAANSDFIDVTGVTTITSLGTTATRNHVWVNFTGILTLTHNAASLILPGGANITTAAGDIAEFVRISGGNWKCVDYVKADGSSVADTPNGSITFAKLASSSIGTLSDFIAGTIGKVATMSVLRSLFAKPQVDYVYAEYLSNADLTTVIPLDDTIPQITEGTKILTATITPKTTTSKVLVRVNLASASSASNGASVIAAVFVNGGTNAIAAKHTVMSNNNQAQELVMEFEHSPASTSSQVYTVRVGGSAGTIRLNGTVTARFMGGVQRSTITLKEIAA